MGRQMDRTGREEHNPTKSKRRGGQIVFGPRRIEMQRLLRVIVLTSVALMPATAFAQASIVGTVRDASGAVVPGVTVEATSPALIEKARSVTTNGVGQYSIEDLRPGTYTVTFSLQGFSSIKR